MRMALDLAREAATAGEVPVGAVVLLGDRIAGRPATPASSPKPAGETPMERTMRIAAQMQAQTARKTHNPASVIRLLYDS